MTILSEIFDLAPNRSEAAAVVRIVLAFLAMCFAGFALFMASAGPGA